MDFEKYTLPKQPREPSSPTNFEMLRYPERTVKEWEEAVEEYHRLLEAWPVREREANEQFKKDALKELGIATPKGETLFQICWRDWLTYHDEDGYPIIKRDLKLVWTHLEELSELIREDQ